MTDNDPYTRRTSDFGGSADAAGSAPAGSGPAGSPPSSAPGPPRAPSSSWGSPSSTQILPAPPPGGWGGPGQPGPSGAPDPGRRPRRRRPLALAAGALAAVLIAGGVGGATGYELASDGRSGGTSVLSSAPGPGSSEPAPAAPEGSVEAVAQQVLPSVVQLRSPSGEGSGIVISPDGLILTNAHVVAGATQGQQSPFGGFGGQGAAPGQQGGLSAVFQNGRSVPVQVVGTDVTADLAVVRAQGVSNLAPAQLGSSADLRVGQDVVAVGSPLGLSGTVTSGIVSALHRPVSTGGAQSGQATVIDAIQTDAAINPGNSGGALVDMRGRVVGITTAIASLGSGSGGPSGSIGLGFAIPIDQAARIGSELARNGFATQAVLGVTVADARGSGAVLGRITPGSAAAAAGLAPGDVVTRLNDRVIESADSLVAAVRAQPPGTPVTLTVSAGGGPPRQVPVTLGTERAPSL